MRWVVWWCLAAVALAGCGAASSSTVSSSDGMVHFVMPPKAGGSSCSLAVPGHTATITFGSTSLDVQSACQGFARAQAVGGVLWVPVDGFFTLPPYSSRVCSLTAADGRASAAVFDTGSEVYGQRACTSLISVGWLEQG